MVQKVIFNRKREDFDRNIRYVLLSSKLLLYSGVLILVAALIYMLVNFVNADSIVLIWLPFMLLGIFLVLISQVIRWELIRGIHH